MTMILNIRKSVVPQSLRDLPLWYMTGRGGFGSDRLDEVRYSPKTMTDLRWDESDDFTSFSEALEACEEHWVDSLAFKVAPPYVGIVGHDALDAHGRLSKYFRPVPVEIGGFWVKKNTTDILGIVRAESVPHTGFGWFRAFLVFVWDNGPAPISGQPVSGLNRDPALTNQPALQRFFKEARWDPIWVSDLIRRKNEERRKRETQLALFK